MTKRVLVTGSSRGIGEAVARRLKKAGYDVVLHGRSESEKLINLQNELNLKSLIFDVSDIDSARYNIQKDIEANGVYYGVVLNAGITRDNTFAAIEEDDWFDVIDTNLNSFYNVLKPIILPMVRTRKPARIVAISSVSGIIGNRGQVNYSASKAGIIGAVKALAIELASRNITVNCVAPGLIETDMTDENLPMDEILKMIPAKRAGRADEVSPLIEFLLSEDAAYITRQVIGVNGGLC
ncbi:3-oxoacyl-ACP reductase FabG [Campylobacter sp. RM16187]|uniref:3-oxoacyl-ACP reductase FabG n=1 Tax=Campylobacter sp. RM16187 TaxID=1660063 RepID=UPI0021B59784|nr:3-oxoacyl-ACP reductase FabG [Campylobacter sp. RM16187]QKG29150.1 3-oxoacyl-[acp] reductase [Campylobacter sp. RM16187]